MVFDPIDDEYDQKIPRTKVITARLWDKRIGV